jgi:hypothetical protein
MVDETGFDPVKRFGRILRHHRGARLLEREIPAEG